MLKKNLFTILLTILITYLSLTSSGTFDKVSILNFPYADKIVHFGMYFCLMSAIILENRNSLKTTCKLLIAALFPLFYSILMEVLQATLTTTRSGSAFDVVFNLLGILSACAAWTFLGRYLKKES